MRTLLCALLAVLAAGCVSTTPPASVHQPMTVRPDSRAQAPAATGGIYQLASGRSLFEDRRARYIGDTLTIRIVEKNQASKKSNTAASRSHSSEVAVPLIKGFLGKSLQGLGIEATHDTTFSGKGDSDAQNDFTGTITVTVIEVFPNGNLLVSGEKQVMINQGQEFIRFSGVVNPANVTSANTVQSTQVADARIEYLGSGPLDTAQVMGWLARFFLTVMPF